MTDFYTACQNRENQIIQETRKQLEGYQVEVKHQDGVYRHLECRNPAKRWECIFEVHSAPRIVTILGDCCKAYTLKAERDMLTEFLSNDEPNVRYWAEKVQNRTYLVTTEFEFVKLYLFDWLDEWADTDMDAETLNRCKYALEQWLNLADPLVIDHLSNWGFHYQDKNGNLVKAEPFYDCEYEDSDWDIWTEEWIRACELLRWTACKVTAMEATQ